MISIPVSLELWNRIFEIGGVILLFLTFVFGAGALLTSKRINARQAAELRRFNRELTDAQTELDKQRVRAADAAAKLAKLQEDAANAKAAQQKVEIELAKQQERAATAESDLLRLKESQKDRTISPAQAKQLLSDLANQINEPTEVWWVAGDSDSYPLALRIVNILKSSGCPNASERLSVGSAGMGFFIAYSGGVSKSPTAVLLRQAFGSVGMPLQEFPDLTIPPGVVRIYIGHKLQAD